MSSALTAPRADIQHLIDDGYEVEVRRDHLLVHSVPYVNSKRDLTLGILVCPCADEKPADHVVSFAGELPCRSDGQSLELHLGVHDKRRQPLFDGFYVDHKFSNKPAGAAGFPSDYYVKMVHYVFLLQAQAKALDPDADARTYKVIPPAAEDSVFRYADSASARAGIIAISQKLVLSRIAIVGLGGSGGYVLDQTAKTPVKEIHLFDGDDFKRHNSFRAPAAASKDALERRPKKVQYFHDLYDPMRVGIVPHPYNVDQSNVGELAGFDLVFVCIDDGPSRKLICEFLDQSRIPFIDVGLGLEKAGDMTSLLGLCRVTMGSPRKSDHLGRRLPVADDRAAALYRSNIQVADMNALAAILAVLRWKQYFGFYADYEQPHHLSFSVAAQSLVREETLAETRG